MTEINLFPKQPQSVTVLVFITVLIVLLLILTVMVHMRNRKLKSTLEEQMAERRLLDKICADFTAVYYVELNTGSFEILHINDGTNVKKMNLKQGDNFNSSADQYAVQYLYEKERQEFKDWISTGHLKEQLSRKERITYHYRSKPNPNQHEFFEAQAVKIYEDEKHFFALVGFRHIDDIMEKETTIQNQLKQALDETRLSNEIISAIAKSYCSIYRIDVQKDFFEEVSNDSEIHKLTGNRGCATEKLYQLCDTMVAPEYRPLIRPFLDVSTLSARLKTEECISTEYRMCDGSWHRMLFTVKKRDESGNVTHVLCTVRSISDSKRREEDLNFAAEAAKREAEMKTRFLATMSHDIRTPINGIMGMVDIIRKNRDDWGKVDDSLDKIQLSTRHLLELVSDVLDMSKLEAGMFEIHEDVFDMNELMDEVAALVDAQLVESSITHCKHRSNIQHTALKGSSLQLRRIMVNLLSNAIKYNKPNGTIDTYAEELSCDGTTVWYEFKIVDTGIGMSEEFIKEQLFKPFTQEKNDARTLYRGTGLGMSIVKALLDKMGGSIEVESQLGEGSTFTFRLPFKVDENAIETKKEEQSSGEQKLEGKQILLVEDNEINMEIAEFYLKELGIVVDKAWNGKEAIDKFEESAPGTYDLILMDIMMPVMGGREAARRIRTLERPDAETVRIYAMTAQVSSESVHKCLASGMNGHIAKPIDESKLREILTRCESVKKQKD